ncbi:hypothetical protein P4502_00440 [Peribacillus frigoritolerans]|uniref:hypothetical protein n=1 Tax=Peribacillus frigoritolerans TaxID=450367 RepID=UPI002E1BA07B|nr:hypothetical protein [Peribacillus frigoritolerans]
MKKFATLLPNIWLAKTPQPLAVRRGRQSAERERISEIKLECLFKKTAGKLVLYGFLLFYEPYWIEEICDTPAEYLASQDPTAACGEEAWQTVGGKGADFRNQAGTSFT